VSRMILDDAQRKERDRARVAKKRLRKKQEAMKQKEAALKFDAAMRSVDEKGIGLTRKRRKKLRA
jgi:hypothetical protein